MFNEIAKIAVKAIPAVSKKAPSRVIDMQQAAGVYYTAEESASAIRGFKEIKAKGITSADGRADVLKKHVSKRMMGKLMKTGAIFGAVTGPALIIDCFYERWTGKSFIQSAMDGMKGKKTPLTTEEQDMIDAVRDAENSDEIQEMKRDFLRTGTTDDAVEKTAQMLIITRENLEKASRILGISKAQAFTLSNIFAELAITPDVIVDILELNA